MPIVVVLPQPGHGHVHLHLQSGHFEHNEGGLFHKMDPVVHIKCGHDEWTSAIAVHGGKEPRWEGQHMKIDTGLIGHHLKIHVYNAHVNQGHHIGEAEVPLAFFTEQGPREEWVELHFNGHKAGRLHFKSEFHSH
mgnify:CR=1 FL=1